MVTIPSLYILCALPFAGKSTLATALAQRLHFVHIELDQINSLFNVGLHGEAISSQEWARTYAEAYRQLASYLTLGQSVLFDSVNFTRQMRDDQRALARRCGASAHVIYINVSIAEVRQRWLANRSSQQRKDVRDEDFAQIVDSFEPPAQDERVIIYHPHQSFDAWMSHYFS